MMLTLKKKFLAQILRYKVVQLWAIVDWAIVDAKEDFFGKFHPQDFSLLFVPYHVTNFEKNL